MKRPVGALLLTLALSAWAQTGPLPGASVESLLAAAREHSPDVRMARSEAEAARERIRHRDQVRIENLPQRRKARPPGPGGRHQVHADTTPAVLGQA
jgi:hypothetical protein